MKNYLTALLIIFISTLSLSQDGAKEKNKEKDEIFFDKSSAIEDRAGGTHNASNIGLFFENRGKLYPRRLTQGPSGEFPINSTKHYVYRINPMVGIPGNVIQGRYTTNEEWEAAYGYHNRDLAQIAFSDKPETWHPELGWPLKDADGNPIIKSDQDSYAVYNDSNNTVKILGIEVHQIGYAYGVKFVQDMIFFTYKIINKSENNLTGLYFNKYTDMDIGNISGGDPEYDDDKVGFNKERNLVYFHDDGISNEWPGGKTGFMGVAFLKTPEINGVELGITDFHYNQYNDDVDIDSIQYGIMSSNPNLFNSPIGGRYFHPGSGGSINYDDPSTLPESGIDLLANISSGPYNLNVGDTLTFITVLAAGETYDELLAAADQAFDAMQRDFELAKPPARPSLSGVGKDRKVILFWNDLAEKSIDPFTAEQDFEGYRIYRSRDRGVNWDLLADFDMINTLGSNRGIQYSYIDTSVINGFEYWYTITAYDRGSEDIASLESPRGNTLDAINTVSVIPASEAIGREPVSYASIEYIGSDPSPTNFNLNIEPIDDESLAGNSYEIGFTYVVKKEKGDLQTNITFNVTDSLQAQPIKYGFEFISPSAFNILNLLTGETIGREDGYNYPFGGRQIAIPSHNITLTFSDHADAPSEKRPETGDLITLSFAVFAFNSGGDTVISPRPITIGQKQATNDGVIFSLEPPEIINSISRVGGTDIVSITFSAADESAVKNNFYLISIEGNGFDASNMGFVSLSIKDTGLIAFIDTVYSLQNFEFDGIEGRIEFNSSAPPAAGNIFSIETIKPEPPGLKDKFLFTLKGSSIDQSAIVQNINKIKVVPNPYIVSSLYEPEFGELRREPLRQIQFINLPPECSIYIFTIDGDLIKTLEHSANNGTETWDLRAESGREIAPGVYLYVVKTSNAEYLERFAVIK